MVRQMTSRILSQSFVWIGSATHDTSDAFRQRQRERIRIATLAREKRQSGESPVRDTGPTEGEGRRASPFKDSRADLDQRGEDLRKKAEMVAAIYERAFARKEGKS